MQFSSPLVQAALILAVGGLAVSVSWLLARIDVHLETNRRQRILDAALERYEQSQSFWRGCVDTEKREG